MRRLALLSLLLAAACGGPADSVDAADPFGPPAIDGSIPSVEAPAQPTGTNVAFGKLAPPPRGELDCRVSPEQIRFGVIGPNSSATLEIVVRNVGGRPCPVTGVELVGAPGVTVSPTDDVIVPPGGDQRYALILPAGTELTPPGELHLVIAGEPRVIPFVAPEPGPALLVAPGQIDFGAVCGPTSRLLTLINTGDDPLVFESFESSSTAFRVSFVAAPPQYTLARGEAAELEVNFDPTESGPASGILSFHSNDNVSPVVEVPVTGALQEGC